MSDHSLHDIYSQVLTGYKRVYVVPLIRFDFPKSDYLFQLYSPFFARSSDLEIHSTSIYAHWKFTFAQLFGKKPILHYHWLEFQDLKSLIGMVYKVKMLWLYKLFGGKLVWTIHNLKPHDGKWLGSHLRLHRWMANASDKILVHSASQIKAVCELYGINKDKVDVFPHPMFPSEQLDKKDAVSILNEKYNLDLNSDSQLFGSFGAISEYKNFESTIHILSEVEFSGNFLIFGYLKKGQHQLDQRLREYAKKYDWLIYQPGFVPENDIPALMNSFDYCLFNFKEISTSGGVEMAKSYHRSIIAPRKGVLSDFETDSNVHLFSSEDELRELIKTLTD